MKVLIVEDDAILLDGLKASLTRSGYHVDSLNRGDEADLVLSTGKYDLLILDLGLPGLDGIQVLKNIRARKNWLPVLILTAKDTITDRVLGLDFGADDYLTKPFDLPELEARVRALIRRGMVSAASNELRLGTIRLDSIQQRVYANEKPLDVTAREISLLEYFIRNPNRVISKEQLIEYLYGWDEEGTPNALEVAIHRLRKKLEPFGFNLKTIRGLGYLVESSAP